MGKSDIKDTILINSDNIYIYIYIYKCIYIYIIYNYGSTQTYTKLKICNYQTPKCSKSIWE